MSKKFGFSDVEEVKSRIEPGVEEVEFTGVEWGENDNGKAFMSIGMVSLSGNHEHSERLYFSTKKGEKISLQRIKTILMTILGEEKANKEYDVEGLNKILTGKQARIKFIGEEYEGENGIKVKTQFAFANFIENIDVSAENSKLHFDSSRNIKLLPQSPKMKEKSKKDVLFE